MSKDLVKMQKFFVLCGEGIECEKEIYRALETVLKSSEKKYSISYLPVPMLLKKEIKPEEIFNAGDWLIIPGGFSFSDHFGSGQLLAYQLKTLSFFETIKKKDVNVLGICNGFQVLVAAGLFGEDVRLEPNIYEGKRLGFVNKWVQLRLADEGTENLRLSVRHGEGRLTRSGDAFLPHVNAFIFYDDKNFNNGSVENIAGLVAIQKKSRIWGLMPHPEVSLRPMDDPDYSGPDFSEGFHKLNSAPTASGARVLDYILNKGDFNHA